jgi:hypothetical protein
MNQLDEAEKELAGLLGLNYNDGIAREVLTPTWRTTEGGGPKGILDAQGFRTNPMYDDRDAFDLLVKYKITPEFTTISKDSLAVSWDNKVHSFICVMLQEHKDLAAAVRWGITMAVIAKLKEEREDGIGQD